MAIFVKGMQGLGDTIYQRPFVKALAKKHDKVYLETSWPEFFEDLNNVYPVKSGTKLRTQSKNISKHGESRWFVPPPHIPTIQIRYGHKEMRTMSIPEAMYSHFRVTPDNWDLPVLTKSPIQGKYVVIRPPTVRTEWFNSARNCHSEYMVRASNILREHGYTIISIADLDEGKEWLAGAEPYADVKFHNGELSVKEIIALVANASLVVASVGFMVPMTMALGAPFICILGGIGGHNAPEKITHDLLAANNKVSWIEPDNFCKCVDMRHDCDKTISNFDNTFEEELKWIME